MFPMCLNENGTHFLGLMAPKYIVAVFRMVCLIAIKRDF